VAVRRVVDVHDAGSHHLGRCQQPQQRVRAGGGWRVSDGGGVSNNVAHCACGRRSCLCSSSSGCRLCVSRQGPAPRIPTWRAPPARAPAGPSGAEVINWCRAAGWPPAPLPAIIAVRGRLIMTAQRVLRKLSIEMYCFSAVFEQVEQARTRGRAAAR
jgi:hypothetical protein